MNRCPWWMMAWAIGLIAFGGANGQEKKAADALVVVDAAGKETALTKWKITFGAEPLPWTEPVKGKTVREEWLAFRDDGSTSYVNGIVNYLPIASLRKIEYDEAKKSVSVVLAGTKDLTLFGTTKFKGINKLTIEGEADLSGLGKAVVKFQGGQPRGVASIRFPSPTPIDYLNTGTQASIVAHDKEKAKHKAYGLKALYKVGANSQTSETLWFKTSVKIDLDKIVSLKRVESQDKKSTDNEFEVALKDGAKHTLILQDSPMIDGKAAKLVGLYGRGTVGWMLFPPHTIAELAFEEKK